VLGFAGPGRPVVVAAAAGALVLAGGCSASKGRADKPASSPPRASSSIQLTIAYGGASRRGHR
jgi:hypothetical protein